MCFPAHDLPSSQNAEFWKKIGNNATNIEHHRLCCIYRDPENALTSPIISNGYSASSGDKKLESGSKVKAQFKYIIG